MDKMKHLKKNISIPLAFNFIVKIIANTNFKTTTIK